MFIDCGMFFNIVRIQEVFNWYFSVDIDSGLGIAMVNPLAPVNTLEMWQSPLGC